MKKLKDEKIENEYLEKKILVEILFRLEEIIRNQEIETIGALDSEEASNYLSISKSTLNKLVNDGEIYAIQLGDARNSKKIYPKKELDRWLNVIK